MNNEILAKIYLNKNKNLVFEGLKTEDVADKYFPVMWNETYKRIGTLVKSENVQITKEAIPVLKELFNVCTTDGGDMGDIDMDGSWFNWVGDLKRTIKKSEFKKIYRAGGARYVENKFQVV